MVELKHKDLIAGVLIALLGSYVAYSAIGFGIGNASRMGPGYLLLFVALGMVIVGVAMAIASVKYSDPFPNVAWRPLLFVALGMSSFALLLDHLGLIPAIAILVALSSMGDPEVRPLSTLILSACVAVGVWVVFVLGLRLPLPAFALDF